MGPTHDPNDRFEGVRGATWVILGRGSAWWVEPGQLRPTRGVFPSRSWSHCADDTARLWVIHVPYRRSQLRSSLRYRDPRHSNENRVGVRCDLTDQRPGSSGGRGTRPFRHRRHPTGVGWVIRIRKRRPRICLSGGSRQPPGSEAGICRPEECDAQAPGMFRRLLLRFAGRVVVHANQFRRYLSGRPPATRFRSVNRRGGRRFAHGSASSWHFPVREALNGRKGFGTGFRPRATEGFPSCWHHWFSAVLGRALTVWRLNTRQILVDPAI